MVIADFNGDGKADVAVLNPDSNQINTTGPYIFIGNGDGTFNPNGPFAGIDSSSIAASDFNGDGSSDIVFVNSSAATSQPLVLLLSESGLTATAAATAISPIGTGTHQVKAVYAGDPSFTGSSSTSFGIEASPVTPTLTLSANPISATFGQQVVLTATLVPYAEPGLNSDGESVTFYSGSSGQYLGSVPLTSGVATLNTTSLTVGTNSLTARYGGNADLVAVTSGAVSLTVVQATPSITWRPPASATYSGKILGALLNATSPVAGAFTYTATLSGGSPMPIGTGSILGAGSYLLTAKFTPADMADYTTASSTSSYTIAPATLTVVPVNATRTYGVANPAFSATFAGALNTDMFSVIGSTSATIASPVGTYPIAYVVTGVNLANYTVSSAGGVLTITPAPLTVIALNATRVFGIANPVLQGNVSGAVLGDTFTGSFATAATIASMVGTYAITPSVSGSNLRNYLVSPVNGTIAVTQAGTATTLALSNGNLTLTANVASVTSGTPTGSVTFYSGQVLIGTGTMVNGVAAYTASSLPAGDVAFSAQYNGDINFTASAAVPVPLLTLMPGTASLTVPQSGSVSDTINLAVPSGYTGTVQLSCSGLPANAVCSFQPASLVFNGTVNSVNATLTVQTSQAHAGNAFPSKLYPETAPLFAFIVGPGIFTLLAARRKVSQIARLLALLILTSLAVGLSGCGGSSSPAANAPTPTGTTSFQVVASGPNGLTQTTTVHLTVQ